MSTIVDVRRLKVNYRLRTYMCSVLNTVQGVLLSGVLQIFYLLIPWSRVHLEKPIGPQLVKKFPAIYGTRRFVTGFTRARHVSLS